MDGVGDDVTDTVVVWFATPTAEGLVMARTGAMVADETAAAGALPLAEPFRPFKPNPSPIPKLKPRITRIPTTHEMTNVRFLIPKPEL